MIDSMFTFLMIGITLVAVIKRTEMALWLFLIAVLGSVVMVSNPDPEAALVFFCGANMILMFASFANWRISKLKLPLLMGVLASAEVVTVFVHYLFLMTDGTTSYACGMIAGTISYIQLVLVSSMKDSRGVMNDMLSDTWNLFYRVLHIHSNNKNSGRAK